MRPTRLNRIPLFRSSSAKLAIFFSLLLIVCFVLLALEIYAASGGEEIKPVVAHVILGMILFICIGLFGVSFYVTKRINIITATAGRIIATRDLSQRIPIDNPWDDLSKLAQSLNSMLEEIEGLVGGMKQVADNIAHDLRTPLTRLRSHIESMRDDVTSAAAPLSRDEHEEQLTGLIMECDGLLATFNALLRITNIQAGRRHAGFHTLNLASVVQDVVELYEPVAQEKQITLNYSATPIMVIGDKDMLFQAAANLLDNAIKHTPDLGRVQIDVGPHQGRARMMIADTGCGISDQHKPLVFRRFYRVDACRSAPGSGLGLSLVQAIVQLHQGQIALSDHPPSGLVVTVTL